MSRAFPIGMLVLLIGSHAYGKPDFPGQVRDHLDLAEVPRCSLCHASDAGGDAISQPFGQALLAAGLTRAGDETLTAALDRLEAEKTDSNRDGIPDIDALKSGKSPDTGKPSAEYGCGGASIVRVRHPGRLTTVSILAAYVALAYFNRRRKRGTSE